MLDINNANLFKKHLEYILNNTFEQITNTNNNLITSLKQTLDLLKNINSNEKTQLEYIYNKFLKLSNSTYHKCSIQCMLYTNDKKMDGTIIATDNGNTAIIKTHDKQIFIIPIKNFVILNKTYHA